MCYKPSTNIMQMSNFIWSYRGQKYANLDFAYSPPTCPKEPVKAGERTGSTSGFIL